jgi:hypothetical protein
MHSCGTDDQKKNIKNVLTQTEPKDSEYHDCFTSNSLKEYSWRITTDCALTIYRHGTLWGGTAAVIQHNDREKKIFKLLHPSITECLNDLPQKVINKLLVSIREVRAMMGVHNDDVVEAYYTYYRKDEL